MKTKKILVTGEQLFLNRHRLLFASLATHFERLECMPIGSLYEPRSLERWMQLAYCISTGNSWRNSDGFFKNDRAFITRSKRNERKIKKLDYRPDLVLHIFGLCCPFWDWQVIPYAMYLDYTMALAARNYSPFAPFKTEQDLSAWMDCERKAYDRAKYIFTMSNAVKSSLITDYGITDDKITVVGSSGNSQEVEPTAKVFGSKQLLFNGSDFDRKGGNLVLETFRKLRQLVPDAKLVIIGRDLNISESGIENLGIIESASELRDLFLASDLVFAPAICDPFPTFVLEGMTYGVPAVVSDTDGMPEIVEADRNGLVISDRNPDLLAQQIAELLNDCQRLQLMSQHGKERIKQKFNWQVIAANMSTVMLA